MNKLKSHKGDVLAVVGHDGLLVSAGYDKSLCIWNSDCKLLKKVNAAHEHIIKALCVYHGPSFGSPVLISGSWDCCIKVWNIGYTKPRKSKSGGEESPLLEQSEKGSMKLGKLLNSLDGHTNRIKCLAALSNHSASEPALLISGDDDNAIRLWDLSSGKCLQLVEAHNGFLLDCAICPSIVFNSSSSLSSASFYVPPLVASCSVGGQLQLRAFSSSSASNVTNVTNDSNASDNPLPLVLVWDRSSSSSDGNGKEGEALATINNTDTSTGGGGEGIEPNSDITTVLFLDQHQYKQEQGHGDGRDGSSLWGGSDLCRRLLLTGGSSGSVCIRAVDHILPYKDSKDEESEKKDADTMAAGGVTSVTCELLFKFDAHRTKVTGLCLSLSSATPLILSAGADGHLKSWDLLAGTSGGIACDCFAISSQTNNANNNTSINTNANINTSTNTSEKASALERSSSNSSSSKTNSRTSTPRAADKAEKSSSSSTYANANASTLSPPRLSESVSVSSSASASTQVQQEGEGNTLLCLGSTSSDADSCDKTEVISAMGMLYA